jgi:hypothetical protein
MKRILIITLTTLILTSCLFDEKIGTKHLTKDFNLAWWAETHYQTLYLNSDHNEYGGSTIIPETVYAIGVDEEFIIEIEDSEIKQKLRQGSQAEIVVYTGNNWLLNFLASTRIYIISKLSYVR